MLTIVNGTPTHLLLPGAAGDGSSLKLPPDGTLKVERLTAALKDAEKRGLIKVGYPEAGAPVEAKPEGKPEAPKGGRKKAAPAEAPEKEEP
jgi:hypothetical protein